MFNIIYAHAYLLVETIFLKSGKDWAKVTFDTADVFFFVLKQRRQWQKERCRERSTY